MVTCAGPKRGNSNATRIPHLGDEPQVRGGAHGMRGTLNNGLQRVGSRSRSIQRRVVALLRGDALSSSGGCGVRYGTRWASPSSSNARGGEGGLGSERDAANAMGARRICCGMGRRALGFCPRRRSAGAPWTAWHESPRCRTARQPVPTKQPVPAVPAVLYSPLVPSPASLPARRGVRGPERGEAALRDRAPRGL